ncbi:MULTISPECIES: YjcZ family sporulation protein [unclassified Virgibacillus]|nr:YjcZ family sporulation protein [Virgibacillus sp. LDC-1]
MSFGRGYGYGCPSYGYTAPVAPAYGAGKTFTLIVVLFILLVIVGAAWC